MIKYLFGKGNNILSDDEAENKLLAEKWYTYSTFVNFVKLKASLITPKAFIEYQLELEKYTPINTINYFLDLSIEKLLIDSTFKKSIRKGIPACYTKQIILKMFLQIGSESEINIPYMDNFKKVFKNIDPIHLGENVPYFFVVNGNIFQS